MCPVALAVSCISRRIVHTLESVALSSAVYITQRTRHGSESADHVRVLKPTPGTHTVTGSQPALPRAPTSAVTQSLDQTQTTAHLSAVVVSHTYQLHLHDSNVSK